VHSPSQLAPTGARSVHRRQDQRQRAAANRQQDQRRIPSADFRGGDNPADHPGMSRAPQYDGPTTIEVVQPERTIVRDVDEALPIALAGSALLLVLATRGITLVRARLVPRPGRSN
jgi:hypothetical protein